MRDKLHDYLLQRPAGARPDELAEIIFKQPGADLAIVGKVVADLLGGDARFQWRPADGTWHAAAHAELVRPIIDTTFTVIDLEMTGMEPSRTGIIEIGAARVTAGQVTEEYSQLINPGVKLPPFIVGLTGIDDEMLREQPPIGDAWQGFVEFAGDSVLVAHNAAFDIGTLNDTAHRLTGKGLDNQQLCTLKLARLLLPDLQKRGLDSLAGHFGIVQSDRHRALGDVRVTVEVLFRLLEMLDGEGINRLDQLLEYQNRARDGRPFISFLPRDKIASLPNSPGVYRLLNEGGELLYIGKAKKLRDRVSSYLTNAAAHSDKTLELIREARDVRVQAVGTELEASLAEAQAIRREKPPFNRLGRHLPRIAFIKVSGSLVYPRLSIAKKMRRGRSRYIGPFRSRKEAERIMELLTRQFQIRTCPGPIDPDPEFTPCSQASRNACTAPCAGSVSLDRYSGQVERLLQFLHGESVEPIRDLEEKEAQRISLSDYEGAARTRREIGFLDNLSRTMKEFAWLLDEPHWIAFDRALDRPVVLAYAVCGGLLAVRARIADMAHLDSFRLDVRKALQSRRMSSSSGDEVEGTTILAAWLRERPRDRGAVIPIRNLELPDIEFEEWQAACRELFDRPESI